MKGDRRNFFSENSEDLDLIYGEKFEKCVKRKGKIKLGVFNNCCRNIKSTLLNS